MLTELLHDAILLLRLKLGAYDITEIEECFVKENGVKWRVNLDFSHDWCECCWSNEEGG
jgi:hypothetical protein